MSTIPHTTDRLTAAVTAMAKVGSCTFPCFSPNGSEIAFLSTLSGIPQVWVIPTTGGFPRQVTALEDQVRSVRWSPDGAWLAFTVAPGGGLNQQIYIVRPDGTDIRLLTDGCEDNNWLVDWFPNGKEVLYSSSRRDPSVVEPYVIDVTTGRVRSIVEARGMNFVSKMTTDGRFGVMSTLLNRGDNTLSWLDLTTGALTPLTPHTPPATFFSSGLSPDGTRVYLGSNDERDTLAFGQITLTDGQPGPIEILLARDDAELSDFVITHDGDRAVLLWNVSGCDVFQVVDLTTLETLASVDLPGEVAFGMELSRDDRYLALMLTGAAAPVDIWVMDMADYRLWQLTHSPHPGVSLSTLVGPELVTFAAHDGLQLSGWLYLPDGFTRPGPIVLSFHGGPEGQERPMFRGDYQALLSQGIAVLAPNVRGSTGFGKRFTNLDNGALRVDAVRDIESCVAYVVSAGIAAPGRIGIMGGSYGGYMTMAGLTEYPDAFAAGVNMFGIVNFLTFFENTQPWMADISKIEYGDPDTQADMLRELSPIHKIDRVRGATLVIHGANDTNVPVVEAEQVVEALKQRSVPVDYLLFGDEGHGLQKIHNRIHSTVAITRWFVEHLTK